MKKSEKYQAALVAVMESNMEVNTKLEVIDLLLDNRSSAIWVEKREENADAKSV
jgi:hypothetical protein